MKRSRSYLNRHTARPRPLNKEKNVLHKQIMQNTFVLRRIGRGAVLALAMTSIECLIRSRTTSARPRTADDSRRHPIAGPMNPEHNCLGRSGNVQGIGARAANAVGQEEDVYASRRRGCVVVPSEYIARPETCTARACAFILRGGVPG